MSQNIKFVPQNPRKYKRGDIIVDVSGKYAYMVYDIVNNGLFEIFNVCNIVDLEKKTFSHKKLGREIIYSTFATIEERNLYFDVIRNYPNKSNINHREGDNLIYAGTLLVLGNRYITMLTSNVPVDGFTEYGWSCMNTRDMNNNWEESDIENDYFQQYRFPNDEECMRFWKEWAITLENNNK